MGKTTEFIYVKGARQNNLKNIAIDIPKNKITVFTGVSGSGKSSLVFETIGAEAQRQINETYDSFTRRRLQHYHRPEVDSVENLNVPIIVNQKRIGGNARSTVGTVTDTYSLLRLLFARVGQPFVGFSNVFSFNNPKGMCPHCEGIGKVSTIDIDKLLDKNKSLNEGAINFPTFQPGGWRWTRYVYSGYFDNDKKLKHYTHDELHTLLHAEEHKPGKPAKEWGKTVLYEGIIPRIERGLLKKESKEFERNKEALGDIIKQTRCPKCKGARLNPTILRCKINGVNIADCTNMQIDALKNFIHAIAAPHYQVVLDELEKKLDYLVEIGLSYLTLSRETASLSGGESQRIKMVKHLGSNLVNLLYIFDEPSIGLHPKDVDNINNLIVKLKDKGNTILVVEHDPDVIAIADHVVDMGPLAGKHGGQIVYQGNVRDLKYAAGLTSQYFSRPHLVNTQPRQAAGYLTIKHAKLNNLKNITVKIPQKVLTVVTGVAGSGKSTLINHVLPIVYPETKIIDQSLIRGSKRSNLVTYMDIFDDIRKLYARAHGVKPTLFSTNAEGACPECKGYGILTLDLAFMEDVEDVCEACHGTGYKADVLQYTYQNKNIDEVLKLSVDEAITFFSYNSIAAPLQKASRLGLGYISLGQRLNTFSGGERQRLKLAKEFDEAQQIFVFDEPTTGLHPSDIENLIHIINALVDKGNTVIVIEHNLEMIAQADWIIDLGPGAGIHGGEVVFEGTAEEIINSKSSETGKYLKRYLSK